MKSVILASCLLILLSYSVRGQQIIDIYEGKVPNAKESATEEQEPTENPDLIRRVITPTLEVYQAENSLATRAAVIICPGGGYGVLVYKGEGVSTAKEFAKLGVTAFVLKYRLPNEELLLDKKIGPLQDALQAIKHVRENAANWGVDPSKVGIMGFSAGGHLASTKGSMDSANDKVAENK
jgi:acetyl esterase/lipase